MAIFLIHKKLEFHQCPWIIIIDLEESNITEIWFSMQYYGFLNLAGSFHHGTNSILNSLNSPYIGWIQNNAIMSIVFHKNAKQGLTEKCCCHFFLKKIVDENLRKLTCRSFKTSYLLLYLSKKWKICYALHKPQT